MNKRRNLIKDPCWTAADLGQALPDSPHAVSVALPRWGDVIAYEEKDPKCISSLRAIYPRFGLNPIVSELATKALELEGIKRLEGWTAWPYSNFETAQEAALFCKRFQETESTIISKVFGLYCLIANPKITPKAKAFWQHTGLGASSRQAAIALGKETAPTKEEGKYARNSLRKRIAEIYCCNKDFVQLHPSGMAALTTALYALNELSFKQPILQLGFPYVDVLKLPQIIFNGSDLSLENDPKLLAEKLDKKKPAAVIVELPSNPMLQCIDLQTVSKLAHERGIIVIADDTIGSLININALPYADMIFSSLTKTFAGRGDILAGSLVISPQSKWANSLKACIAKVSQASLADSDAIVLEEASRDIKTRIPLLNQACTLLKEKLEKHPSIERVLHPGVCPNFQSLMRPQGGYGCLLSFELKEGLSKAKRFYDSLRVCKGPSLGTNFTLVCPYVLLAHYTELEWAEKCGVPAHLLRVSVGLEEPNELWERFEAALIS